MRHIYSAFLFYLMCVHPHAAEPIKMRTIAKGGFSGFEKETHLVITNETQWTDTWKKLSLQQTPAKPFPKVDFEKETVLLAAMGQKRSGGYAIEITRVEEIAGKFAVTVAARAPKPGGMQLQAISAPFHIVAVPRLTGPVLFRGEK
jgi:hypothetical protein